MKILHVKTWLPVMAIGIIVLIFYSGAPVNHAIMYNMKELGGPATIPAPASSINWGDLIGKGLVTLGSVAGAIRGVCEIIKLFTKRRAAP